MEINLVLTLSYSIPDVLLHQYPTVEMAEAAKRRHIAKAKAAASSQPPKTNDPVELLKNQWKKRGVCDYEFRIQTHA